MNADAEPRPRSAWAKCLFGGASVYGICVLAGSLYALPLEPVAKLSQLAFVCVATAFQMVIWVIGSDPVRYRPLMPAAIVEKISFGIVASLSAQSVPDGTTVLSLAAIDILLGSGFAIAWYYLASCSSR